MTLVTDGPLSLPVMQPKLAGEEFLQGNHALLCTEDPVRRAPPQLGAGDSGWMRSERPMVWCCFFVRAQVS